MAKYKPPKVKSGGTIYETAKVLVRRNENKKITAVRVQVLDSEATYDFKAENCPEYVQPGEFKVAISSNKEKLLSMSPIEGMAVGKVFKFVAEKDKPPAPRTFHGENWDYEYFGVLLQITRGNYKGMQTVYNLRYHFVPAVDKDGKSIVNEKGEQLTGIGHDRSKYTPILEEFLDVTDMWNFGPLVYKDNLCPAIEKRILRADKEFNILFKDGWVDKVFPLMEDVKSEPNPEEELNLDLAPDPEEIDPEWEQAD